MKRPRRGIPAVFYALAQWLLSAAAVGTAFFAVAYFWGREGFFVVRLVFSAAALLMAAGGLFLSLLRKTQPPAQRLRDTASFSAGPEAVLPFLQSILGELDECFYINDPDTGEVLFANRAMLELCQADDSTIGRPCHGLMFDGKPELCRDCPMKTADRTGQEPISRESCQTSAGRTLSQASRFITWLDGRRVHLHTIRDITEKRLQEEQSARRQAQQQLMGDIAQRLIGPTNMDQQIYKTLEAAGEFLGLQRLSISRYDEGSESLRCVHEWLAEASDLPPQLGLSVSLPSSHPVYQQFIMKSLPLLALEQVSDWPDMTGLLPPSVTAAVLLPVMLSGQFWGLLSLEGTAGQRAWRDSEERLGRYLASTLAKVLDLELVSRRLEQLSAVLDTSPDPVLLLDAMGCMTYINEALCTLSGYGRQELLGQNVQLLFDAESYEYIQELLLGAPQGPKLTYASLILLRRDGQPRSMQFFNVVVQRDPVVLGLAGEDVTAQTRLEDQVSLALQSAGDAKRAKSEFLSRLSHEILVPLGRMETVTEALRHEEDVLKRASLISWIDDTSGRIHQAVRSMLQIADSDSGDASKLEITEFSLIEAAEAVLGQLSPHAEEKMLRCRLLIEEGVPKACFSDRAKLEQILRCLISNAIKFTPRGGRVFVSVSCDSSFQDEFTLKITVQDTGAGFSAPMLDKLSRSLENGESSVHRREGGVGLGLALSRRLAAMLGGCLWVDSQEGRGSAFSFTLVVRSGQGVTEEALAIEPNLDFLIGKHILLAEDSEIMRDLVLGMLHEHWRCVHVAARGDQAVDAFADAPDFFDLILMDIDMPGLNGLEATKQIRQLPHPCATQIPIVAMTANSLPEDVQSCLRYGMNDHISKPVGRDGLISKLRKWL